MADSTSSTGGNVAGRLVIEMAEVGAAETAAGIEKVNAALDQMALASARAAEAMGAAEAGAGAGAATSGRRKKGIYGSLMSLKTLAAVGIGYEAVKGFSNFEASMERIHTQTAATQSEVNRLSPDILKLSKHVGIGPDSLADSLYHVESTGVRGKAALEAVEVASKGAKIGIADLTDSTNAMTAVVQAGFRGTHTLEEAMGQLNATVGSGDMKMQDLNEALSTGILSTVKDLGLEVKDTGAALAVLGDNNIRGAQAATRLRMGLMMLVKPSEQAQAVSKKLGLSQYQLAEDLAKPNGLLVMLKDLKEHTKDLTKGERNYDLAVLFGGGRNSSAMLTLFNNIEKLEEKYKIIGQKGHEFNDDWKDTTKTLKYFIDTMKATVLVELVKFGGHLADVINWVRKHKVVVDALKFALIGLAAAWSVEKIIQFVNWIKKLVVLQTISKLIMGTTRAEQGMIATQAVLNAEMGTGTKAMAIFRFGAIALITTLAQVTAAIGGVIGVAEIASRLLGKGSFVNNVKELLAGHDAAYWQRKEYDYIMKGEKHHEHALHGLAAARRAHPDVAKKLIAQERAAREHRNARVTHSDRSFAHHSGFGGDTHLTIELDGKVLSKSVVRQGLKNRSSR